MRGLCLLLGWLVGGVAWADERDLQAEQARLQARGQALLPMEQTQLRDRGWRDRRPGEVRPLVSALARPADYQTDVHRGTVEYLPTWTNYSFHQVEIPDGTVVVGVNLSQIAPQTEAVRRAPGLGQALTFRDCNLTNVRTFPDWTLVGSNNAQVDMVLDAQGERVPVFVASRSEDVPALRVRPVGALE